MTCTAKQRSEANDLVDALTADPRVLDATTHEPAADPTDSWVVEAHVRGDVGGFPADLLSGLSFGPTVRCRAYNGHWRALLIL